MTQLNRSCVVVIFSLAAMAAFAQEEEGFSGKAALGYLATSGNSETESLNASFDLAWDYAPWHHSLAGLAVTASANNVDTAEAYGLGWQTNYDINETDYIFGLLAWNKDEFSSYDQQIREAGGYGRRFIDTDRHVLSGEAGIGARQADLRDGTSEDEAIVRLGADYRWIISETTEFTQVAAIEAGSDNTYLEATSALSATIRGDLALVVSFTLKSNSDVLPGTEKTDTFTAVSLEYSF